MRLPESRNYDMECPTRYAVDEARFCAGQDRIRNEKEVFTDEPFAGNA